MPPPPFDIFHAGLGHGFDTVPSPIVAGKGAVTYEGYTYTKFRAQHPGQTETWALVNRAPMLANQKELQAHVKKQKQKGPSARALYNDNAMTGFKRKQIDTLIRQRTIMNGDPRFEYNLAGLQLKTGRNSTGQLETQSMQTILRRQLRAGAADQLANGLGRVPGLGHEIVDLTIEDERSSQPSFSPSANGHFGHPIFPVSPEQQHPYSQMDPPMVHPMPGHEGPQHHGSPVEVVLQPDPFVHPYQPDHFPPHDAQHPHQERHYPNHETLPTAPAGKTKKPEKKASKSKDHPHAKSPKSHEKYHKTLSDASSDSFSDLSDASSQEYGSRTPDTVISSNSGRNYVKEKKNHGRQRSSRRGSHSYERDASPHHPIYREHHRKVPTQSPRTERSRYQYDEYDSIPASPRDRPHPSRHAADYPYERPSYGHHRTLSYDDDRHYELLGGMVPPARRSSIYGQGRLKSSAHPVDLLYEDREEMASQLRRDEMARDIKREARGLSEADMMARNRYGTSIYRERPERHHDYYH